MSRDVNMQQNDVDQIGVGKKHIAAGDHAQLQSEEEEENQVLLIEETNLRDG